MTALAKPFENRLPPQLKAYALGLQKNGKTLREIAEHMHLEKRAVEQSLYWDVVRK